MGRGIALMGQTPVGGKKKKGSLELPRGGPDNRADATWWTGAT